jgi:hypothetical protein
MISISSFDELDGLLSRLHDCPFDLDKARFDRAAGTWTGTFFGPLWEKPAIESRRSYLIVAREQLPVAQALLVVMGVHGVQIIDDQGIGRYSLNYVERTDEGVCLRFNEVMRVNLQLKGEIEATYEEQVLPGTSATYRSFLIVQCGPTIEPLS